MLGGMDARDAALVRRRRAIGLAICAAGLVCATAGLLDSFGVVQVPGAAFFLAASWLLLAAALIFQDVSGRWRTPRIPRGQ